MFPCIKGEFDVCVVVAMRGGYVDDVHVWIGDEGFVAAVRFSGIWRANVFEEGGGTVTGGGGCGCDDVVADGSDVARLRVDEEVACKSFGYAACR